MIVIGFVLAILGLCMVAVGVAGAAFKVFVDQGQGFSATDVGILDVLNLVPKILEAITKAPNWLGVTATGVILVLVGVTIARLGRAKP
jgi:hypothetical protein